MNPLEYSARIELSIRQKIAESIHELQLVFSQPEQISIESTNKEFQGLFAEYPQ